MFDDSSSPAHWWPDGLAQDNLASRAFTDPAQQPLNVVHMNEGFIDFEQVCLHHLCSDYQSTTSHLAPTVRLVRVHRTKVVHKEIAHWICADRTVLRSLPRTPRVHVHFALSESQKACLTQEGVRCIVILAQAVDLLGNSCDGAGGFDVNSDQAFCDVLDAYIWPSNESLDGLLRCEIFTFCLPHLESTTPEAFADTTEM